MAGSNPFVSIIRLVIVLAVAFALVYYMTNDGEENTNKEEALWESYDQSLR